MQGNERICTNYSVTWGTGSQFEGRVKASMDYDEAMAEVEVIQRMYDPGWVRVWHETSVCLEELVIVPDATK